MHKVVIGIVVAAGLSAGCGQARSESGGPATQRSYQVGGFDRIEVAGPYEVDVRTGSAASVSASGGTRDIERMVVEVEGGILKIHPKKRRGMSFGGGNHDTVRLTVTVPSLAGADIAGSGAVKVDKVSGERFKGEVAGSGELRLAEVAVRQLTIGIAGSGEFTGAGRAATAEYEIAGSGDIDAANLIAERADVSIAGSGRVAAHATATAAVDIAGSGDVTIRGGAKCTVSKAGSGNVDCA